MKTAAAASKSKSPAQQPITAASPQFDVATAFRLLAAAGQVCTVWVTWPLWQARESPPLLPLADVPSFSMGAVIVATIAVAVVWPRLGVWLHGAALAFAMLQDQTRVQPEFVSLWLLMVGTLPASWATAIGRAHLISLWLFSGMHKLISPAFFDETAKWLYQALMPNDPPDGSGVFGLALALGEIALGLGALVPQLRRFVAVGGVVLHLGITATLVQLEWNVAVWPWNIVLAVAGFVYIGRWRESAVATWRAIDWRGKAVAAVLLVSPVLYYFGVLDAYLAYCLYSSNVPDGRVLGGAEETQLVYATFRDLNVPLPPTYRTYIGYFRATGNPAQRLYIHDQRTRWSERTTTEVPWSPP